MVATDSTVAAPMVELATNIEQLIADVEQTVSRQVALEHGGFNEEQRQLQNRLTELLLATPVGETAVVLLAIVRTVDGHKGRTTPNDTEMKIKRIAFLIDDHVQRVNVLRTMAQGQPTILTDFINQMDLAQLEDNFRVQFSGTM